VLLTSARNYVQELQQKRSVLGDEDIRWHIIGHLQSNKARIVAPLRHLIHAWIPLPLRAAGIAARARPAVYSTC